MIDENEIKRIAIKYVYVNHDSLTNDQEVKHMIKDIKELIEVECKKAYEAGAVEADLNR